ncbi:hypothetical protein K466DRAFT_212893 [Polyporus arcularius HHB13444]|uniref:Uncharacterized protein n=1 Tax=Polyporus arcularius HHB13444 TaxID=1314778 RepID=A0A5C3P8C2_9APHY|nr:hypothetical protein K466DRAFT_212893 [Polyporus arcularius HHB13444]
MKLNSPPYTDTDSSEPCLTLLRLAAELQVKILLELSLGDLTRCTTVRLCRFIPCGAHIVPYHTLGLHCIEKPHRIRGCDPVQDGARPRGHGRRSFRRPADDETREAPCTPRPMGHRLPLTHTHGTPPSLYHRQGLCWRVLLVQG